MMPYRFWNRLLGTVLLLMATNSAAFAGSYSSNFKEYWVGAFQKQNTIVLVVLGLGAVGVLIISTAKWKK